MSKLPRPAAFLFAACLNLGTVLWLHLLQRHGDLSAVAWSGAAGHIARDAALAFPLAAFAAWIGPRLADRTPALLSSRGSAPAAVMTALFCWRSSRGRNTCIEVAPNRRDNYTNLKIKKIQTRI